MFSGYGIVEASEFCDKSLSIVVVDFTPGDDLLECAPGVDLERRELDFTDDGVLGAIT
jgi:hypothetical protein